MKILRRVLLLVVCCVLIWPLTPLVEEAKAAKGLLFPIEQVSDPAVPGNTIQYSNTTRNIAVAMDGKIYVVYKNASGIYVNSSIDRGETMGTPVRVSTDTNEPEIAVSTNGTLYVSWVNSSGVMFSRSTDGGQSFSTPALTGSQLTSATQNMANNYATVHMATDGLHVYILDFTGQYLYVSHDSGQTFSLKTFADEYVFSDVMVDRQTHEVIVQKDNPSIRYHKSSDYGETFGSAITPSRSVSYSVGGLGTDGSNTFYYICGSGANLEKINIATGAVQTITVPTSVMSQGRSLSADDYGNVVIGYIDGSNNLIFQESNDSGATFEDTVIVDTGSYSSAAINHTTGDILYAYEKAGQIYLAVYGEYLEGYVLNISHAALSFAGQLVNTASDYKTVTLTNDGETPITINSIVVSAPFTIEDASLSSILVGGSADIRIRYEPTTTGDHTGAAVITYEGTDTKTINLSGTAVSVNPLSISSIANQSLNSADAPKLVSFTVSHTDSEFDFSNLVLSATSTDQTLVPNGNMSFTGSDGSYTLSITPADGQSGTCEITVFANDLVNEVSEPFELTVIGLAPPEYSITYNLDGGTNHEKNPATYTTESELILFVEPERDGYLFSGWFTSADFAEGTEITEIPSGSSGDIEVWVKWIKIDNTDDYGIVMGNISTEGGEGKADLAVTLKSSPRTTFTDVNGDFSFEYVIFEDHQLVITNSAGTVIGEYDLKFSQGNETSVVIEGTTAYITYISNSVAVQIDILVNEAGTSTTLENVTIISNPQTGWYESDNKLMITTGITLITVIMLTGIYIATRKNKHSKEEAV